MNDEWYDEAIAEINASNEMMAELQSEIKKKTKLLDLVKADKLKNIKDTISRDVIYLTLLYYCKDWYKSKEDYKYRRQFVKFMKDTFGRDDVHIQDLTQVGYSSYAWTISFFIPGKRYKYALEVPDPENLSLRDLDFTVDGKLALFRVDDSVYDMIAASYKIADIKEAFTKEIGG